MALHRHYTYKNGKINDAEKRNDNIKTLTKATKKKTHERRQQRLNRKKILNFVRYTGGMGRRRRKHARITV